MLAQRATCGAPARSACRRGVLVVKASGGNGAGGAFQPGQKVKVTSSIKIYHAPKHPTGLDLSGMEGTVVKDVTDYKGKVLSANFPYKVEFVLPAVEGKAPKVQAHLVGADCIASPARCRKPERPTTGKLACELIVSTPGLQGEDELQAI